MNDSNSTSTTDFSDDDLPDIPLAQRLGLKPLTESTSNSALSGLKAVLHISSDEDELPPQSSATKTYQFVFPTSSSSSISSSSISSSLLKEKGDVALSNPKKTQTNKRSQFAFASSSSTSISSTSISSLLDEGESDKVLHKVLDQEETDPVLPVHKKMKTNKSDPLLKRKEKDEERQKREEEKLRKKLEKEKETAEKRAAAQRKKALKPGECQKGITVDLDTKLLESDFGGILLQEIQTLGAGTQIEPHPEGLANTIFFWRNEVGSSDPENRTLELFCIVYMTAKEYVSLVANSKNVKSGAATGSQSNTLLDFVREKDRKLKDVKLTLLLNGIEKHFRNVKTLQQRDYRQRVQGVTTNGGKTLAWSDVNRLDVEESKIELQLFHDVHVIQVETKEEMAAAVVRFSKSVAERPHKQMLQSHSGGLFSFCADAASTSVKPNSLGEGLLNAWRKQLTQFTLISDDVAAAVTAAYPAPRLLRNAYRDNPSPQLMLKDLNIRRGTGPLETSRKVGPELSKRIFQFFTAVTGDETIVM